MNGIKTLATVLPELEDSTFKVDKKIFLRKKNILRSSLGMVTHL